MAPAEAAILRLRILSALVLAPLPLVAIWLGGPWLPLLTIIAAIIMAWEWSRLCGGGVALVVAVAVTVVAAARFGIAAGGVLAAICAIAVWLVEARRAGSAPSWTAAGGLWIGLPCIILLWLAQSGGAARGTLLWLFAVVWATDIGAYVFGRQFGGPLLAPRWSPRKTWAGLIGGIGCAALVGWAMAHFLGAASVLPLVAISAGLAVVDQFGDLAESVAKRRFGVKDASSLIPGHGGLLDRLDGFLAVVPAVALLSLVGGGSVLIWR